jgi:hypothetical protein
MRSPPMPSAGHGPRQACWGSRAVPGFVPLRLPLCSGPFEEYGDSPVCQGGHSDGFPAPLAFLVECVHCGGGARRLGGRGQVGKFYDQVLPGCHASILALLARDWEDDGHRFRLIEAGMPGKDHPTRVHRRLRRLRFSELWSISTSRTSPMVRCGSKASGSGRWVWSW